MSIVLYILAAIVMLGIMAAVHEAGHFFAARLTGIPVKEFAIGFGPKILSWNSKKHETRFFLRAIPAGGYCMFYGEDDTEGTEAQTDPRAIGNYAVWRRAVTIAAGPVMNFVLAFFVAVWVILALGDVAYDGYMLVAAVSPGSPAAEAGFQEQDVILAIDGEDAGGLVRAGIVARNYKVSSLVDRYQEGGEPLSIEVRRGEETLTLHASPLYDQTEGRYLLGVGLTLQNPERIQPIQVTFPQALSLSADACVWAGETILSNLGKLFTDRRVLEQSSGLVGIIQGVAEITQEAAQESAGSGLAVYAQLLVVISMNLGLFNLIPIPGLDGSRLIFLLIEAIRRKPVPRKLEACIHLGGFMVIIALMLVMTGRDLIRIFQ